MKTAPTKPQNGLTNHEIVTLAVYLLGGDTQYVDTEDIAVKANEIAPDGNGVRHQILTERA